MSLSMKFPGAYFQGKDALEEFASIRCATDDPSCLLATALRVSKEKLAHSFSGLMPRQFELHLRGARASEIQRVTKLAADSEPRCCAPSAAVRMDIVHPPRWTGTGYGHDSNGSGLRRALYLVSVLYSGERPGDCGDVSSQVPGSGLCRYHCGPGSGASAGVRHGRRLATWYEMEHLGSGHEMSNTQWLPAGSAGADPGNGMLARLAAENHIVILRWSRVIEANCLSGIGGVNTGCSGAHGFGDYLFLSAGRARLYARRAVMVGLVIQLILRVSGAGDPACDPFWEKGGSAGFCG